MQHPLFPIIEISAKNFLNLRSSDCVRFPRRTVILVGKVWVGGFDVASIIPKTLIYHGNKDASIF